jgi:hypothetical protein
MFTWIAPLIAPSIVLSIAVVSIVIQLSSRRKDKYQRIVHALFYRTQRPGAGAWGLGPWYYGAWDVEEKLNESIAEGKAHSSHQRPHHHQRPGKHHGKQH